MVTSLQPAFPGKKSVTQSSNVRSFTDTWDMFMCSLSGSSLICCRSQQRIHALDQGNSRNNQLSTRSWGLSFGLSARVSTFTMFPGSKQIRFSEVPVNRYISPFQYWPQVSAVYSLLSFFRAQTFAQCWTSHTDSAVNKFWSRRPHWESRRQLTFLAPKAQAL